MVKKNLCPERSEGKTLVARKGVRTPHHLVKRFKADQQSDPSPFAVLTMNIARAAASQGSPPARKLGLGWLRLWRKTFSYDGEGTNRRDMSSQSSLRAVRGSRRTDGDLDRRAFAISAWRREVLADDRLGRARLIRDCGP